MEGPGQDKALKPAHEGKPDGEILSVARISRQGTEIWSELFSKYTVWLQTQALDSICVLIPSLQAALGKGQSARSDFRSLAHLLKLIF